MKNTQLYPFERNKYFYGKLLSVEDFTFEQKYMNDKRRHINRLVHGVGVVCGLNVVRVDDTTISVESGLALDSTGREIVVEDYLRTIDRSGFFEVTSLSDDDLARTGMYRANAQRVRLRESVENYEDFLKSLKMKATIRGFEPAYTQRIAQLTNRSNQFNLTTLRCTESDIAAMQASDSYLCLYGRLEDKFGDNGVVSVVAGQIENGELHIRLWVMSCRVLKRRMEDAMLDVLVSDAKKRGVRRIVGYYYPTRKNGSVRDFYERMGFSLRSADGAGNTAWELEISAYEPKDPCIEIYR